MKNMSWTALAIAVGVLSAAVVLAQSGPATPTQDSAKSVTQPEAKQETKMPSDGRTKWEYRIESIELLTGTSEKSRNDPEGMKMRAAAALFEHDAQGARPAVGVMLPMLPEAHIAGWADCRCRRCWRRLSGWPVTA